MHLVHVFSWIWLIWKYTYVAQCQKKAFDMFFCKSNQSNISLSYLLTFLLSCPCVASTDVYTTLLLLQRTTTTPEIFPLFVRPVPG